MRKSIYVQLVFIFIAIFIISNFVAFMVTSSSTEQNIMREIKGQLESGVIVVKEVYENGSISSKEIEKLFEEKYIQILFLIDLEGFIVTDDELLKISNGEVVIIRGRSLKHSSFNIPVAVIKSDNFYIIAQPKVNSILANFRSLIMTVNITSVLIGSIIFLFVAGMIVRPIKKLTMATKKIARGDFDVELRDKRKDEIGQLVSSFNIMTKELKSIEILRNDFVSDISHEFRTPLTSIEGYTKLLKECESHEVRTEYVDIILEETQRLSTLSSNILTLNRIENGNITFSKEKFSLDEQIRKVILLYENKWSEKHIDLHIDLDKIKYLGNAQMLHQVWLNLLDNAIKFSPKGEKIEIKLNMQNKKIMFSIKNYGKEIDIREQQRIFDKFYKGDKSRNSEGNGLGLSIVKRMVDIHGGKIFVKSEGKLGTEISIELPYFED